MRETPIRGASGEPGHPLSRRTIFLGGVLGILVAVGVFLAVLHFYGGGTERDHAGLDVVRTTGTLVVGIGGFIALLLTARRQRYTELTLEHQREVAAATERDARDQRVTELYTRAVDQLGNEKAPVRLGGLHALERLAQKTPEQQQTIVDVICAYLRMPYTPPDKQPPGKDVPDEARTGYENRRQELQVRLTAQRILAAHLRPDAANTYWPDIDLDLTQAYLHALDLTNCHIRTAQFAGAQFTGEAEFSGTNFDGAARFNGARFSKDAEFNHVHFRKTALFDGARFGKCARFEGAHFYGDAFFSETRLKGEYTVFNYAHFYGGTYFMSARFGGRASFISARFIGGDAWFNRARFAGDARFDDAEFAGYAWFDKVRFAGYTWFEKTKEQFSKGVGFSGARVASGVNPSFLPTEWTTRAAQSAEGEKEGWLYVVRAEGEGEQQPDQEEQSDSEAGTSSPGRASSWRHWRHWRR